MPVLQVLALALLCALVSMLFCLIMHRMPSWYDSPASQSLSEGGRGGLLVILLTYGWAAAGTTMARVWRESSGPSAVKRPGSLFNQKCCSPR